MELKYDWKESNDSLYYFNLDNGEIVGHAHKIAHSSVCLAKIIIKNDEDILGRYISIETAKKAVENYWLIESRTLIEN
jgi:hypothetical protein